MNLALRIIIDLFIAGGCFFAFAGAVGLVRMPDTFTRMQSSTNITTLGVLLTLIGALLATGEDDEHDGTITTTEHEEGGASK